MPERQSGQYRMSDGAHLYGFECVCVCRFSYSLAVVELLLQAVYGCAVFDSEF